MSEPERNQRQAQPAASAIGQWQGRTPAEWATLGISLLITVGVIGLLIYDLVSGGNAPALIEVEVDYSALRQEKDVYYLPITVTNRGGQTAEDATIHFVLQQEEGLSESTSLTFRFRAPGERANASLIFNTNPATGSLTHTSSYLEP